MYAEKKFLDAYNVYLDDAERIGIMKAAKVGSPTASSTASLSSSTVSRPLATWEVSCVAPWVSLDSARHVLVALAIGVSVE
jgi:hypothetical protein